MFNDDGNLIPIPELDDETAGMLSSVEIEAGGAGEAVTTRTSKLRRADPLRALELLGKHLGMFKERVEHSGQVAFVIER